MLNIFMEIKTAIKSLVILSLPIIIGQIGQMLIGAGDVLIASKFSTESVASIGVANGVINPIFLFGIGLMMGISPCLAMVRGKGENTRDSLFTIIVYSGVCGVILSFITIWINQFVPGMGFKAELIPSIQKYISIVAWSFPFAIIFQGIKEYLQSYEDVFFANSLSIIAVIFNLLANYALVFGVGEFSGYGEVGLAIASFATRLFQFLIIVAYVAKKEQWHRYSHKLSMKIFKFSLPIAFMFFLEVLAFCTVTMLSGNISITAAASNNIIMTIASIVFMVPLSVSSAVAVKIGHSYGQQDEKQIRLFSKAAVITISGFILFSCSSLLIFPHQIMNFITQDSDVINLGIKLLFIVAIFQISDSLQVVLTGILRGLHQTKTSSIMVFIGYWVLGIPIGYYLAYYDNKGAEGLWIGLALSLTFVAIFMAIMTSLTLKKLPSLLENAK